MESFREISDSKVVAVQQYPVCLRLLGTFMLTNSWTGILTRIPTFSAEKRQGKPGTKAQWLCSRLQSVVQNALVPSPLGSSLASRFLKRRRAVTLVPELLAPLSNHIPTNCSRKLRPL